MARIRTKSRPKQAPTRAPLVGCIFIIVLAIVFLTWAMWGALSQK